MEKKEREFIDSWIEENVVLIATQSGRLLTHYKNNSSNYGEVLEKLNRLKKNVSYNFNSKLLLPIIEAAIEQVERERNTLPIKEGAKKSPQVAPTTCEERVETSVKIVIPEGVSKKDAIKQLQKLTSEMVRDLPINF